MKGKFQGLSRDLDGGLVVSFRVYDERKAREELDKVKDIDTIDITAKRIVKKRSMSANAYYWVLIQKAASVLEISTTRCHNLMLRRYGVLQTYDGQHMQVFIPDTDKAEEQVLESETYHLKPTSAVKVFKDGNPRRMYRMLKGSSEYDSKEMSVLIHGLVDECKTLGIETLTPHEIDEILKEVEKRGEHHRG